MRVRADREGDGLPARHAVDNRHLGRLRRGAGPLLGGSTGDEAHIGAGFARQIPSTGEPVAHAPRSGIIGGSRKSEISKFMPQVAQELRGFRDRLGWVEGVCKPALARRSGHELRYALCSRAAHRLRVKAAFLPDQSAEEIDR